MIITLNNLVELREKLSTEFWFGNRWLAFESPQKYITIRDIKCFDDLKKARMYCQHKAVTGQLYHIKALGSVLKVINCGFGWRNETATAKLKELLNCFPITSFRPGDDLISSLLTGEYYPVVWSKIVYPLSVIDCYHIVEWDQASVRQHMIRGRVRFTSNSFIEVLDRFRILTGSIPTTKSGVSTDLMLIGQFSNQPLKLNAVECIEEDATLLIYKAHIVFDTGSQCNAYKIHLAHDVSVPITLKQGAIVKYDPIKGKLDFYDSCLRKVRPATFVDYLDLAFFAYKQPIEIATFLK